MSPEAALQRQIERYQQMTGEQRLTIALEMHESGWNVARAGSLHQFPNLTSEQVDEQLRRRIELSRQ